MRVPLCLEDRGLLGEEPFASSFSISRLEKKKELPTHFLEKITSLVEAAPGGIRAVEEWVNMAFIPVDPGEPRKYMFRAQRGSRIGSRTSRKKSRCFVKFHWYLFTNQDPMKFLTAQNIAGYTRRGSHLSTKEEPSDEPMRPLPELADAHDIPQLTARVESPISVTLSKRKHSSTFSGPGAESESITVMNTPVRAKLRPRPAPPVPSEPRRRGRPRATGRPRFDLPADTSPLLPSEPLTAPPTADIKSVGSPGDGREINTFLAPVKCTQLSVRPVREGPRSSQSLVGAPVPRLAGIQIKPEPSESESSQLLNFAELPENWLTLPVKDISQTDQMPVLHLLSETQPLPKPPLKAFPPIWAQSRQEVCESFEWFRSYQGGVYQNNGSVKGYFLSAFSAQRDCFQCGGKIVISHGGGKADSISSAQNVKGQAKTAVDQRAQDSSVQALLENYRKNQPLVLLIDDKYEPFPFDLSSREVYMTVLGFYKIIHTWAEYQSSNSNTSGRVVRYKFAFQWCEDQGEPWWSKGPSDAALSPPAEVGTSVLGPTLTITSQPKPANLYFPCAACSEKSPRVYRQAWACLNPACSAFWTMPSGQSLPENLDYNTEFLTVIDHRALPLSYRDALLPKTPVLAPHGGVTTSYAHTRGWHCRKCGRLSCRSAWELYQCPNCKDTHKIVANIRQARTLMSIRVPISDKFVDSEVDPWSSIQRLAPRFFAHSDIGMSGPAGRCQTFILPDGKGKIHLIQTNRLANLEADQIFEAYQKQASDGTLLLRRWPLRSHKLRGQFLTNYFSQNSGETYHYVGGGAETVPFVHAPSSIVQARDLIQKRIHEALGTQHKFNEVLSAAYMEQQKMAFHSDSEHGLGPVVAGLSMGSPALMHFRLLSKYVPRNEQRANAMTVVLRHGDVLVMEGAGVQDFYEHTVVPCNFRIAATARWIEPHHA